MAKKNLQQDLKLVHRKITFQATNSSMKANHSAPASLLKVPRKKAAICHLNTEISSESETQITACHSTENIRSSQGARTPIRLQEANFPSRKNADICHSTEKIGLEQEAQNPEDNLEPKRKTAIRRSTRNISSERQAGGLRLQDTSSQTDPVVIFVGDVSIMVEKLKELDTRNKQFVLGGNEVLVEVCDEDDLQKLVVPDHQLQQPAQKQLSASVICSDGCSSPEGGETESGTCSQDLDNRLGHDQNEERGLDSRETQGQDMKRRQWQDPNDQRWQDSVENQWHGPNSESEGQQYLTKRMWQEQYEKQGQYQWQSLNEKQWQGVNEKQQQDPGESQRQDPNERQEHDQDERSLQDLACNQEHILSVTQENDPISGHWQDPNEKICEAPNEKKGQDLQSRQSLTKRQGQKKLYTQLQVHQPSACGFPLDPHELHNTQSMLTVFQDSSEFANTRRGKGIRVRGGIFQRSRVDMVMPESSNDGGVYLEGHRVALHGISDDSGVLYEELNQSQHLAKKPKPSRRCVKPRAG